VIFAVGGERKHIQQPVSVGAYCITIAAKQSGQPTTQEDGGLRKTEKESDNVSSTATTSEPLVVDRSIRWSSRSGPTWTTVICQGRAAMSGFVDDPLFLPRSWATVCPFPSLFGASGVSYFGEALL
jgi:hypothetical protein